MSAATAPSPGANAGDTADAVTALYAVAADEELTLLDELVERARLGFKCRAERAKGPCLHMNVGTSRCEECGGHTR